MRCFTLHTCSSGPVKVRRHCNSRPPCNRSPLHLLFLVTSHAKESTVSGKTNRCTTLCTAHVWFQPLSKLRQRRDPFCYSVHGHKQADVWCPDFLVYMKPMDADLHLIHRHLTTTSAESRNRTIIYRMPLFTKAFRISRNITPLCILL